MTTAAQSAPRSRSIPSLWLLWFGMLAAPTAWATHLSVGYFLVTIECRYDVNRYALMRDVATAVLFALAVSGCLVSIFCFRRLQALRDGAQDSSTRARFMAVSGIVLSILFTIGMIFATTPAIFLESCRAH